MAFSDLNELEKIGLAFICGFIAGNGFEEDNNQIENEIKHKGKHSNTEEADVKIEVGKLEGEAAKKFMNMIEKMTKGDK